MATTAAAAPAAAPAAPPAAAKGAGPGDLCYKVVTPPKSLFASDGSWAPDEVEWVPLPEKIFFGVPPEKRAIIQPGRADPQEGLWTAVHLKADDPREERVLFVNLDAGRFAVLKCCCWNGENDLVVAGEDPWVITVRAPQMNTHRFGRGKVPPGGVAWVDVEMGSELIRRLDELGDELPVYDVMDEQDVAYRSRPCPAAVHYSGGYVVSTARVEQGAPEEIFPECIIKIVRHTLNSWYETGGETLSEVVDAPPERVACFRLEFGPELPPDGVSPAEYEMCPANTTLTRVPDHGLVIRYEAGRGVPDSALSREVAALKGRGVSVTIDVRTGEILGQGHDGFVERMGTLVVSAWEAED